VLARAPKIWLSDLVAFILMLTDDNLQAVNAQEASPSIRCGTPELESTVASFWRMFAVR